MRGLSPASKATHKGLDTAGRRRIWHPRTPLAIARQMLQPRHVCRASLPPGGEATQLQTGALEGFGGRGAPRAGAPPGLIPEAALSCGGCMEPFPEPFQSSSWGQKAESRAGWGGLGWVQELRRGTQGPGLNGLRGEEISCVSALRKQQPGALGSSKIQVSLLGPPPTPSS